MDLTEKRCPKCNKTLPADAFYPIRGRPDGLGPWCKVHTRLYQVDQYRRRKYPQPPPPPDDIEDDPEPPPAPRPAALPVDPPSAREIAQHRARVETLRRMREGFATAGVPSAYLTACVSAVAKSEIPGARFVLLGPLPEAPHDA